MTVTEVTRRNIIDRLTSDAVNWHGRLGEIAFLERLFNLDELPSNDSRFGNAREDIVQHRLNNDDWPDDWIYTDHRFGFLHGESKTFLAFLAETLHPVVRASPSDVQELLRMYNAFLAADAVHLEEVSKLSGRPVYSPRPGVIVENLKTIFLGYPFALPQIREALERACAGFARIVVASDRLRGKHLLTKIDEMIQESDLALFDLTGHNPNVAAEFGIAYARNVKWAILYCTDPTYKPSDKAESRIFSDLEGMDSIRYSEFEQLESEARRLLPEYLAAEHVGLVNAIATSKQLPGRHDSSLRPRLHASVKFNYGLVVGASGSPVKKIGTDTLLVTLSNKGRGAANGIEVRITGFDHLGKVETLAPGEKAARKWPLEDQPAYLSQPALPKIRVAFTDDNGDRYEQEGALEHSESGGRHFYSAESTLGPPQSVS
jgi:hypothetical protein